MEDQTPLEERNTFSPEKRRSELAEMLYNFWEKVFFNPLLIKVLKKILLAVIIVLSVLFVFSVFLYIVPGMQELSKGSRLKTTNIEELKSSPEYKKQMLTLNREVSRLSRKYTSYTPGQTYLVINTTYNRFYLYRNKKLFREGFCSSGSYTRLTSAEGNRHWTFKTPKGGFWIQQKITKPLWIRPDWSFVEEGLPIPAPDDASRFEFGVLGDYAMSLGDGYLIHGTLYKRFLGMPVTHGCVRLNDEDLEAIYNTLNIGSKVFIF
jgi:lipoprotein-anchoring transpeptidase ErfK/SrfK